MDINDVIKRRVCEFLGIKVMSYPMLLQISIAERRTFHQIQLQLTGERQTLRDFMTHLHESIFRVQWEGSFFKRSSAAST